MINCLYFGDSELVPPHLGKLLQVFENEEEFISSEFHEGQKKLDVLHELSRGLEEIGFRVRNSPRKSSDLAITNPKMSSDASQIVIDVDAFQESSRTALIVLAGRGVMNNEFHKSILLGSIVDNFDFFVVGIRNFYHATKSYDYEEMAALTKALISTERIWPERIGLLLIGY
jgi:hypothetical protein